MPAICRSCRWLTTRVCCATPRTVPGARPNASTRWCSPACARRPRRLRCAGALRTVAGARRSRAGQHRVRGAIPRPAGSGRRIRQGRPRAWTPGARWASATPRSAPSPPSRSPGIRQPRLFRLPADRALLNRMGFNNHGAGELALRLARHSPDVPIGREHRQDEGDPARGRRRRLPRQRATARPAGRVSGGQRQLAEHPGAARPAGGGIAAADPGGACWPRPRHRCW